MIIDVHGHYTKVPPELDAYRGRQILQLARGGAKGSPGISDDQLKATLQVHLDAMARRGVDKSIFSPRAAFMGHEFGGEVISRNWTEVNNDLIARAAAMYPEQFVPACQLPQSPGVSPANTLAELERCVGMGFVGCNINPDVSGGVAPLTPSLGDRWWYPLWEKMCELDVPGLIHAGSTLNPHLHMNGAHYVNTDVAAVVELTTSKVLTDFPDLKVILAHPSFPWQEEALAIAVHKPNVYIDLSGWSPKYFPEILIRYTNTLLKHKMLFGSDYPLITPDRWLADFAELPIKDEVRPLVLKENAARLLGLAR